MYRKQKLFLLIFIALSLIGTESCKKDDKVDSTDDLVGDWELEKLIIDGIDTTNSVKSDSNCYGITRFYLSEFGTGKVQQTPYYSNYGYTFHCLTNGGYLYTGQLIFYWSDGSPNIGPYLSDERLSWDIVEISKSNLKLKINYHGMPCELAYKRM